MLYPELGHEVIDELRSAQLVANQMPDRHSARNHVQMVAGRLPLHELFGINFDADSEWAVFESLEVKKTERVIKFEEVALRGEARSLVFVFDPMRAIDSVAVRLSNIHVFADEAGDAIDRIQAAEIGYTVQAAHLPVLALKSWARAS